MRVKEFLYPLIEILDTKGLHIRDWIILYEQEMLNTTLLESLDQNSVRYLQGLISYSAKPIVGDKYIPILIMLMTEPDDRLVIGNYEKQLVTLLKIRKENSLPVYDFLDNTGIVRTFPENRLTALSFYQLYLFKTQKQYDKFNTFINMKFTVELPEVSFNES